MLVIQGTVPSKKNQKQIVFSKKLGRPLIIPSKQHKDWHTEASQAVKMAVPEALGLQRVSLIKITIYPSTMRAYDLTNKAESIADLLVDTGLLADDNAYILGRVLLLHGGKDAGNPRAEVVIYY